ncbi:VanW family protein [Nonomuraea sp. NPDC000554]|uniref:VanW family protein n=1 Tax=Nonomuraea sp. NPDC000554 TaxID=3154259 RepID=UPI00332D56C5
MPHTQEQPTAGSRRPPRSRRARVAVLLSAVLVVAGAAYAVPAVALAGDVPPGTRVDGSDIGGLAPSEARSRLERDLGKRAATPLALVAAGRTVRLKPAELGLAFDAKATVDAALDGATTPAGIVRSFFGSRDLQPKVTVDEQRLTARLADLARDIDTKPREGGVRFRGLEPQAVQPRPGRTLDRDGAARAVRDAFAGKRGKVALTVRPLPPTVSAAEVRRVATTARAAVASPLTLTSGGRKTVLSRDQLAAGLRFTADGQGGLRPSYDASQVASTLEKALVDAGQRPKDASFKIVNGRPRVVAARAGRGIDVKALGEAIAAAVAAGTRSVDAPTTRTQPRVTTQAATKLGVKEKVSSFTTRYPCCAPRVTNIHTIADLVDGYVVRPGETFSLNGVVGKRDKARGFVEAPMILNNRFVDDVGGGVSQFTTTLFNAVFFGGFQDVQHTPHQYYISRYPAGRESTVSYPQPDFRWRNDSPYGVLIKTSYTDTSVTVDFWSTKRYDVESQSSPRYQVKPIETITETGKECIPMAGAEGFTIDVWRIFKQDGKVLRKQQFHTVYAPEPRLTCT